MHSRRAPAKRRRRMSWREALRRESELARSQQIRAKLSLPMNKRVGFLRVRLPDGSGSHL